MSTSAEPDGVPAGAVRDAVYLDASALVKLVTEEPESAQLREHLGGFDRLVSCTLARVEVVRAARSTGEPALRDRARHVVDGLDVLIGLDDRLLDAAADLDPTILRSLHAIHIAAALQLREVLGEVVTYDARMADAVRAANLTVAAPGA